MKSFSKILFILFAETAFLNAQSDTSLMNYIDSLTDSLINQAGQPGLMVSITCSDKTIYEKAKGYSDIQTKEPMDLKMRFRIGSLTKTFTTTVVLQLVDEGKIKLDETIDRFFPDFPDADKITIRMLGDMSSGIHNYSETKEFDSLMTLKPKKKWKPEELIDIAIRNSTYFLPGKGYHYSNTNTVMLGVIIEQITGNSLDKEIDKRIIKKLGLTETEFPSGAEISGYHSHGYNEDGSSFTLPLTDVTEKYDPSWGGAAGAMISSLKDLKVYLKAFAEGLLISAKSNAERMKWSLDNEQIKYGFGLFRIGNNYLGHNGSYPGFRNISVYSPDNNCTVIIFCNSQTDRSPDELLKKILGRMQ